jgi:hypothetical protein
VAQLRVGAGKLLIATFRFDQYRSDPYATHLLDSLIAYVCGGDCQPIMQVPERLTASSEAT